jgi:hypothetical protein
LIPGKQKGGASRRPDISRKVERRETGGGAGPYSDDNLKEALMMKHRRNILSTAEDLLLVFLLVFLAAPALADDKPKEGARPATAAAKPAAAPAHVPSQEEMMKAWTAAATPGEAHKKLEPMVGSFTVVTKMWMDPSKPPEESTGTTESKWVLGGRFVEQQVEGTAMGQPFHGIGYTGYDNYKKKYVGSWVDSMGTMIMTSTGTADASGKKFTFWSTIDDVVMKKPLKVKGVLTIVDDDHHAYEMWAPGPDGKMFKSLEIAYTRKK